MSRVIRSVIHLTRRCSLTTGATSGPQDGGAQETNRPHKKITKFIDRSKVIEIDERDIVEKHVSGSGPGGQSVNKSVNACQLKHIPTGIVVKVHQSRSLEQNRKLAREILQTKLDNLYNGENSVEEQKRRLALQKIEIRKSQSERRRQLKEQFRKIVEQESTTNKGA